ncbi:MAG: SH3 domain-containing protein [Saprospiraceae bacterium]
MKMRKLLKISTLFLMLILIVSCGNEATEQQSEQQPQQESEQQQTDNQEALSPENTLVIQGDKVNLRDKPTTLDSKVVGQVNSGETFVIKSSSDDFETIGKQVDYWYEIEKDGKSAWVFGAFTSRDLNNNPRTFRGVYDGTEWGDYFYLTFQVENKDFSMDFGEGANHNDYGEYDLEEKEDEFKGKTFDVIWKVLMTETYAGEGSMEIVEREVPYIVDLQLVE